jgi:hypothetical protein
MPLGKKSYSDTVAPPKKAHLYSYTQSVPGRLCRILVPPTANRAEKLVVRAGLPAILASSRPPGRLCRNVPGSCGTGPSEFEILYFTTDATVLARCTFAQELGGQMGIAAARCEPTDYALQRFSIRRGANTAIGTASLRISPIRDPIWSATRQRRSFVFFSTGQGVVFFRRSQWICQFALSKISN